MVVRAPTSQPCPSFSWRLTAEGLPFRLWPSCTSLFFRMVLFLAFRPLAGSGGLFRWWGGLGRWHEGGSPFFGGGSLAPICRRRSGSRIFWSGVLAP